MSTTTKNKKSDSLVKKAPAKDFNAMSFDEIYHMDEKEKNFQLGHKQNKEGKRLALTAKISTLQQSLIQENNAFIKSLTDPKADSVEIKINMYAIEKEIQIAKDIYNSLFPETQFI